MKPINQMTLGELAAFIDSHLQEKGIDVVLSGGASVTIYTNDVYVSKDIDFIAQFTLRRQKLDSAMSQLGFRLKGKYYFHPQTPYFVEFLPGPPSIGQDPVEEIRIIQMETGSLRVISPTDSVKDRLAAFYHWGDRQCLEQALLIVKAKEVDMVKVESWSIREGKQPEFEEFQRRLKNP